MNQAALAKKAGLSAQTISELEAGRGNVRALNAVTDALGLEYAGVPRNQDWSTRCRTLRVRKGLSISELAEKAGVSEPALRRLEAGSDRCHVASLASVLAILAPKARGRKPQTTSVGRNANRDDRFTPLPFFEKLVSIFGDFDLDPASHPDSPVAASRKFFGSDESDDGLKLEWQGKIYLNPPYSFAQDFSRKAHAEYASGNATLIVALLPVRTHTRTFHSAIAGSADVFFLPGRMKFANPLLTDRAPFGLMLAIWGCKPEEILRIVKDFNAVHLPKWQDATQNINIRMAVG